MVRSVLGVVTALAVLAALGSSAQAAENVQLFLKANGVDIHGEGPPGPYGTPIECFVYEQAATSPRDAASGMATGRRQYQPIVIRKRIDKATPLIAKALTQNESVEAIFRFMRTVPGGQKVNVYTVEIKQARVAARKDAVASTIDAETASWPAYEEVSFTFNSITWRWEDGGIEHTDSWSSSGAQLRVAPRPPGGP